MTRRSARSIYLRRLAEQTGGRLIRRTDPAAAIVPEAPPVRPVGAVGRARRALAKVAAAVALDGPQRPTDGADE